MPLPLAEPDVDLDTSILEDLNFDHTPKCDNDTCDNDATHTIRCHCGVGMEYSCSTCIISMQQDDLGVIKFDGNKSCGHLSLIIMCTVAPL